MSILGEAIKMLKIMIDKADITVNGGSTVNMKIRRNGDVVDIVGRSETVVGRVELPKVNVTVNDGTVLNLSVEGDVQCAAVAGNVTSGGDISCASISGNVQAGGDVNCKGAIFGKITAGGDVIGGRRT